MHPSERRDVRQELRGNAESVALALRDSMAEVKRVPANDDGGKEVQAGYAEMLALQCHLALSRNRPDLAATEQPVNTSTAAGKAFFDMLGVFAEFETNLRRERQAAAKQRGAYRGRPPRIDMEAIKHRLAMGLSPTAIARELGISRGTVY